MISEIEDNEYCRTALAFAKGDGPGAGKSNGESGAWFHKRLAKAVLQDDPSGEWETADENKLATCIKNRLT